MVLLAHSIGAEDTGLSLNTANPHSGALNVFTFWILNQSLWSSITDRQSQSLTASGEHVRSGALDIDNQQISMRR